MTDAPLGLGSVISAERARESQQSMRACLREVATRGTPVWTAGLVQVLPVLVEVARIDLCLARLVEGHADGLRIIDQANGCPHDGVYAVWASRSAGTGVKAAAFDGGWRLDGELRFASGLGLVDRALVPVWLDREHHLLLDLPADIGDPDLDSWKTCAMDAARSFDLRVDSEAPASSQLGPANFYLQRPGFVLGGLCVAAVWVGGARHVVDVVTTSVRPFSLTRHQQRRIGVMEQAAWQAQTVLEAVAGRIATSSEAAVAREVALARTAAVLACEAVIDEAGRVVGPAGLGHNLRLARVVHDLAIYIRQHQLDTELERLGEHAVADREGLAG